VTGVVTASGLAGVTWWQRATAEKNEATARSPDTRDSAAENLGLARHAAEGRLSVIAQGLRNLQGMRAEAVRPMLESLVTKFEQLASSFPDEPASQASRAAMLDEVGNAYFALGDFYQALRAFRDSLDIRERMAGERNNKDAQHALSVSHYNVGETLRAQGYLDDALEVHNEALEIRERLVAADPGNAQWQHGLSVSYEDVGSLLERQGKLALALIHYRSSRTVGNRLAKLVAARVAPLGADAATRQRDLSPLFEKIGGLAYKFVLEREFKFALQCAEDAIAYFPDLIRLQAPRAHALMFLNRADEARTIFLRHRGYNQVIGDKAWDAVVLGDIAQMREAGLTHPLMDEIEKLFTAT
jgi:tetratricopeptide (TPR) repeat protein